MKTKRRAQAESGTGLVLHLLELRNRLLKSLLCLGILFLVIFPFANPLYHWLSGPLLVHLPDHSTMIAVEVVSPFLAPLKMALYAALLVGMPYLLYQIWSFVAPGLYRHEQNLAMPLLISSVVLFYAGVAFAYFVVFPLVFSFLVSVAPPGVAIMTDISKYLDFVLLMFFAFGAAFEVPIATIILIAMGATSAKQLAQKRPYIIVGAFVVGMLLTPPDVISQVMLALPMWVLFEIGIVMSRILIKQRPEEADEVKPSPSGAPANYSVSAYPSDYKPLSEEEAEAEMDRAKAWEDKDAAS